MIYINSLVKKDVNLTILCDSEFLIKNDNNVIYMFSIHQGVKEIHFFVEDNINNLISSIVIPFG